MAKPEWGTKRLCPGCGAKFYDLGNTPPLTCPKCENEFEPELLLKPRRGRVADAPVEKPKEEEAEAEEAEEKEAEDAEDGKEEETAELDEKPLIISEDDDEAPDADEPEESDEDELLPDDDEV